MTEDKLKDFISKKNTDSPFVRFSDNNGTIEGRLLGYNSEEDPFNRGNTRMVYVFEIDGKEKRLGSSSARLAKAMNKAEVKVGDSVRIIQIGEKFETQYKVDILGKEKKVHSPNEEEVPPTPDPF